jgi:hypothetical protein
MGERCALAFGKKEKKVKSNNLKLLKSSLMTHIFSEERRWFKNEQEDILEKEGLR